MMMLFGSGIPNLLATLQARATYYENVTCTTETLDELEAIPYTAPVLPTGLLADYPGASAAYSLRNLIDTTTSVVRVRRSYDNTEANFTATEITDGTLATFCSGTDGFVAIWYDQSGNGNNALQTTANDQPKIVENGVVLMQNTEPKLNFNGSHFDATGVVSGNPKSIFVVAKSDVVGVGGESVILDSVVSTQALIYKGQLTGKISVGFGNFLQTSYSLTNATTLYSVMHNGANSNAYVNSTNQILTNTNLGTNSFNGLRIGAVRGTASLFWNGNFQEIIVYPLDQSTNRTGIETNINAEYSIY
jgi:hypothetical protein